MGSECFLGAVVFDTMSYLMLDEVNLRWIPIYAMRNGEEENTYTRHQSLNSMLSLALSRDVCFDCVYHVVRSR
jgi:hypothetical protein